MMKAELYDVVVAGGGLAGLAAAILLRRKGFDVLVVEKEHYPFHRVCGEYLSRESQGFLQSLGLNLEELGLPEIHELQLTAPNGRSLLARLEQGGFGISRYKLDGMLANIAKREGVEFMEGCKVLGMDGGDPCRVEIQSGATGRQILQARIGVSAHGKKSNLDLKWDRSFLKEKDKKLENYVGVKYHIQYPWPKSRIALHNFPGGYCGISAVEEGWNCLCYLTHARNLKKCGNDLRRMEREVLAENPCLRKVFSEMKIREEFPITISQISFSRKTAAEEGILMLGDAAGMITPLCGNGMSMALHSGKIAAEAVGLFLQKKLSSREMIDQYRLHWNQAFSARMARGRMIQRFFGSRLLSNAFVSTFKIFPCLKAPVVKMTHGKPF